VLTRAQPDGRCSRPYPALLVLSELTEELLSGHGGEAGSHLGFSFSDQGVYYGITLHPWTSIFRFSANGVTHTLDRHSGPAQVVATLRSIVGSALVSKEPALGAGSETTARAASSPTPPD
jgi:hypothetical protein